MGLMKVTADMTVANVLKQSKKAAEVFRKYNLYCIGCKGAVEDTIMKVAVNNGIDVKVFVEELNKAMRSGS